MTAIDESILLWINNFEYKSAALDRIMIWLASDYFVIVIMSLMLLAIWFFGKDATEREGYQRALIVSFISMGSACGFIMAANHLYFHPHPFESMPELMSTVDHIFYPIVDPSFPSNTSAVSFAAVAALWQRNHKLGLLMLVPATLWPLAKVYACVYWPSDVIAGAILGIMTAYFIKLIMPVFEPIISRLFIVLRKICIA